MIDGHARKERGRAFKEANEGDYKRKASERLSAGINSSFKKRLAQKPKLSFANANDDHVKGYNRFSYTVNSNFKPQ